MWVYYLMYFVAAAGAILRINKKRRSLTFTWWLLGIFYVFIIGFRACGGDWYNYLHRFRHLAHLSLNQVLEAGDKGYRLLSYFVYHQGWGFETLTAICAALSMTGLIIFVRKQPNPWLGLVATVPYLIIVVYMGYMRQGVALGFIMWAISELNRGKFWRFVFLVAIASAFHKTAVIMITFGIFAGERGKLLKLIGLLAAMYGIWISFMGSEADALWQNYVETHMQSHGALIRTTLNTIPSVFLFYYRKQWKRYFKDYTFWKMIAIASFISIFLVKFAATAVDRMSLYFIPLQIVVYARLPVLAREQFSPSTVTYFVVFVYFVILSAWLNFAVNSFYWIPYQNILFKGLF